MQRRSFALPHAGRELVGFLDEPERATPPWPVVVGCHGFKGFCEWGFWPPFAELMSARGCAVVRFNFSGAGMRLGEERVSDLAAFAADTYSRERDDLLAVLAALATLGGSRFDLERIGLVGHSRGGAIALLAAACPEWRERLRSLVTWNTIGYCDRWPPAAKAAWRAGGELPVENSRTGQRLALGLGLLDELERNDPALDLAAAARARRAPWLLLQARDDEAVPFAEGEALAAVAAPPAKLLPIAGTGHTFGAVHPFAGPTPHLIQAFNATQTWLLSHLSAR